MTQTPASKPRFFYLDNLRSFVVLLVVVMHSNVTYSGMGSWYYTEARTGDLGLVSKLLFGLYGSFTQAWFMGILFFLSGALAARSLARRTPGAFARERLFRLGAPLLLYMVVVHPLTVYAFYDHGRFLHSISFWRFYTGFVMEGHVLSATGPLWFAEALLIFSLAYAGWRFLRKLGAPAASSEAPRSARFALLALATGVAAFCIRQPWPTGTSVLNLQFCYFASYITLFILGVHGGERGWFERVADCQGRRWLIAGLIGIPAWLVIILSSGAAHIEGGWHWQAAVYGLWEAFVAISMAIGLVVFFRRYAAWDNRFTRLLSKNAFRIYMFHTPVLVGISVALAGWHVPMLLKHAVVAPLACAASLLVAILLRYVPGLEEITR